jgi:hypothetical protein
LGQVQPTDMQIDGGRGGRSVAKKHLDMMEARSRFNQMGSKGMPLMPSAGLLGLCICGLAISHSA